MKSKSLVFGVILLPLCAVSTAALAQAGTLYKCVDESGIVLYTNQKSTRKNCTVLSVQPSPPPTSGAPEQTKKAAATATPTPSDFPRVSSSEQKARDTDRRAILERELATEQTSLEKARQALSAAGANPLPAVRDTVALHERNIQALNKELAKIR
jgi:multidrug resistance efflux pump